MIEKVILTEEGKLELEKRLEYLKKQGITPAFKD
jgi:hypothetical protein